MYVKKNTPKKYYTKRVLFLWLTIMSYFTFKVNEPNVRFRHGQARASDAVAGAVRSFVLDKRRCNG
jgi:hypothetical protein